MALTQAELWRLLEPIVKEAGLEIYEVEGPSGKDGSLKVFIWKGAVSSSQQGGERGGVNVDDCAVVSRRIAALMENGGPIPEDWGLEVSSPGINRKLSRPEHYQGAVGERVRVKAGGESARAASGGNEAGPRNAVFTGKLLSCNDGILVLEDEKLRKNISIGLGDVREARVDFQFGSGKK